MEFDDNFNFCFCFPLCCRRNIFNWAHRIVGTLALILGGRFVCNGSILWSSECRNLKTNQAHVQQKMKFVCFSSNVMRCYFSFTVVSIYFGLNTDQVGLGKMGLWAVITFYIAEFLVFLFEVYLIMSKRNREKRSVPMGNAIGKKMLLFGLGLNRV